MYIPRPIHNWSVSPKQAIAIQRKVATLITQDTPEKSFRFIAGVDVAFAKEEEFCIAGAVLWDLRNKLVIEQCIATDKLRFPYIPGLLSFREAPAIIAALRKLQHTPDVLICDGQGLAHPRRCGIACHLGVLINLPAIGCAKSRLTGSYTEPGKIKGAGSPLLDQDTVLGTVLRTRDFVKPVFVSIGHKIDLPTAEQLVLACATGYRLPEPTRLADHLVTAAKQQILARR